MNLFGSPPTSRHTDVYTVSGVVGDAIKIEVTASGFTPWVDLNDPTANFFESTSAPPLEFYVTTTHPYEIRITSNPSAPEAFGSYTLKLTQRTCPASQLSGNVDSRFNETLAASDCPNPIDPTDRAKIYTFTSNAGEQIHIEMTSTDVNIDPTLQLNSPSGGFAAMDLDGDSTSLHPSTNSLIEFLNTRTGTYTVFASGGLGHYNLVFARTLPNGSPCRYVIATVPANGSIVTLPGSLTSSGCTNPLSNPGIVPPAPDLNSHADLYRVTLAAGDLLTATAIPSDDTPFDPHLFLLGPDNSLVAENDVDDQIGFTAGVAGNYIFVLGTNLFSDTDGFTADYRVTLQRCPATSATIDVPIDGTFTASDCEAMAGIKSKSYRFVSGASQFATFTANYPLPLTPRLTLISPDGRRVESVADPLLAAGARVSRMLSAGTYYLEVSGIDSDPAQELPESFSALGQSCPTQALATGVTAGTFSDTDCTLEDGTRFDVYTISGPPNTAASLQFPDGDCSVAVLSNGTTTPGADGCSDTYVPVPLAEVGTTAVMVNAQLDQSGSYQITYRNCPLTTVADVITDGAITDGSCLDATDLKSEFYLVRAAADRMLNAATVSGSIATDANIVLLTNDLGGPFRFDGLSFDQDPTLSIPYTTTPPCQSAGNTPCLGFLLELSTTGATGAYRLDVSPLP